MKNIKDFQREMSTQEKLNSSDMLCIKGGAIRDDKRRQRPGGGTTTSSPSRLIAS